MIYLPYHQDDRGELTYMYNTINFLFNILVISMEEVHQGEYGVEGSKKTV